MTEQERNLDVVRQTYAALEDGFNIEKYKTYFASNAVLHEAASLPYGGTYIGPQAIGAGATEIFSSFDNFNFEILNYLAADDLVVVHVMLSAKGRATGKVFAMPLMEMWRLQDGKIVESRPFYFDTARVSEVYGS